MAKSDTLVKPRNDAYTGILLISLLAMIGACVLLYLDYSQYDSRIPPKTPNIETPAKGSGTGTPKKSGGDPTPKVDPMPVPKVDPMTMMAPTPMETTSIKPVIEPPPMLPISVPILELPGIAPTPVSAFNDRALQRVKAEEPKTLPIRDFTLRETPMKVEVPSFAPLPVTANEEPRKLAPPLTVPSPLDEPPVLKPFVPEK